MQPCRFPRDLSGRVVTALRLQSSGERQATYAGTSAPVQYCQLVTHPVATVTHDNVNVYARWHHSWSPGRAVGGSSDVPFRSWHGAELWGSGTCRRSLQSTGSPVFAATIVPANIPGLAGLFAPPREVPPTIEAFRQLYPATAMTASGLLMQPRRFIAPCKKSHVRSRVDN